MWTCFKQIRIGTSRWLFEHGNDRPGSEAEQLLLLKDCFMGPVVRKS